MLPEDLDEPAAGELRVLVGLREVPGDHARSELPSTGMGHRAATEQAQEMRLARAVRSEHPDPLAVVDLGVERAHQAVEFEPFADDCAHPGAPTAQAHRDLLLGRLVRRRAGRFELLQPRAHRPVLRSHVRTDFGLLLQGPDEFPQPGVLLVPAPPQLGHPVVLGRPCLVVGQETAAVHPDGAALDGHDPVGNCGQQFPVVADEKDRLGRLAQPILEPALSRHVEVVVGFVEQQHLVRAAQQHFQGQALLLAAGQRRELAVLAILEGQPDRGHRHRVPQHLDVVAARVAPVGQRVGVVELGALVLALHQHELRGLETLPGVLDPRRGEPDQELLHRGRIAHGADELPHHTEPARSPHCAALGRQVARDDAQQGGLAGSVRPHQGSLAALADPEADTVEQQPPVGQGVADTCDIDVPHGC